MRRGPVLAFRGCRGAFHERIVACEAVGGTVDGPGRMTGSAEPAYRRETQRIGPVPTRARLAQGIGALPDTFKDFSIKTFLLLYYNQVLGLSAFYVSLALAFALVIDALTDPLVGSWSDNFRSRLGRRHPFMYASAVPLGVFVYLLFAPPEIPADLPREPLLLAWLLMSIVGARVSMTFFAIPWGAMFAEFSDDYRERSAIVSYRFLMAWLGGIVFSLSVLTWVFPATPAYPLGQLNPEAYRTFAWVLAIAITVSVLVTAHSTRNQIPFLMQPTGPKERFRWSRLVAEARLALRNRDFLMLLGAVLASAIVIGTVQALEIYVRTYFWGLDTGSLRWLTLSFCGALLAFATVVPLQNRFDKKHLLVVCSLVLTIQGMLLIVLRLLDVLPENGDPRLLAMLVIDAIASIYLATIAVVMFVSMIADTLDVQELQTGLRQEGLFSSAVGFSSKATSGFGLLAAGALLDGVIGFPADAGSLGSAPVEADVVLRLGVVAGLVVPLANVAWMALALRYGITRERHAEVRAELDARHGRVN